MLNIAIWNANGLSHRLLEIKNFLQIHNIDVMLISETHFTIKNYFKLPYHEVYDTKHPDGKAHGGTAIIIKKCLNHFENEKYSEKFLQATTITIMERKGPITLSAVYCPPKYSISSETFQKFFENLGNRFIAGGDYNAKHPWWGSRLSTPNPKGRNLYEVIRNKNYNVASTGEPTYWPSDVNKTPDLIDFAVTYGINPRYITAKSCLDLSSDHSPILLQVNAEMVISPKNTKLYNRKTNWNVFKTYINDHLKCNVPLKNNDQLEDAIENFNKLIHVAVDVATPSNSSQTKKHQLDIPPFIAQKIKEKRHLRRIWQKSRRKEDKKKVNCANNELKNLLALDKNVSIQKYLEGLSSSEASDYSLWKATKKITRPQNPIIPIRLPDGKWARTEKEKARTFALHFSKVFDEPEQLINNEEELKLLQIENTQEHVIKKIQEFKVKEVISMIKNLKTKKAPGYDSIDGHILKNIPLKATRFITILINSSLRLEHFPDQWKVAQIILIPKPGKDHNLVSSYRPISLLPIISKIFEKLLANRINKIILEKKLIPNHQFGFRNKHATIEQVNRITNKIRNAFERKKYCSAAFLDVSQAFDKVWHKGLLFKLKKHLPAEYYNLLKSYLSNRSFQIKINTTVSELYNIKAGVPQGSVLGPILYLIYTSDLPTSTKLTLATYADDTAIMACNSSAKTASQKLQIYLNVAQDWYKKWRIKINEDKSTHVTFTLRKETCPSVYLNGKVIPRNDSVKYLGMHLDRRLTWRTHIWTKRKQLNLKFKKMYWLLGKNSKLTVDNKLLIYKSILKPVWTYGIQLWGTTSNSNVEILERFQSKALRSIVNAPWFVPNELIQKDLQIPSVKEEISSFHNRYKDRLTNHPNILATNILQETLKTTRLKKYKTIK